MFRKSDELIAIMRRVMIAIQTGDTSTARGIFSSRSEALFVGNRGEWLYGLEGYEVLSAQLTVVPEYDRTFHSIEAYEDGSIGWGAANSTVSYPNGESMDARTTAVFHLEEGTWRVVQWHASSSITENLIGIEAPKTLSDLVDSLDADLDSLLAARFDTAQVAFVISDIEDSAKHGVELGDLVWSDVVSRHFDQVTRITDANRGTVIKTMGDGVLMAFDTPVDAANAAVGIQQSVADRPDVGNYNVRIGVHAGQAVHADDDYFGYTVNKTARIASAAGGNEILVTESIAKSLSDLNGFTLGDPRPLKLKGLPGTHIAYVLALK